MYKVSLEYDDPVYSEQGENSELHLIPGWP